MIFRSDRLNRAVASGLLPGAGFAAAGSPFSESLSELAWAAWG